eukprot:s230_g12.t1
MALQPQPFHVLRCSSIGGWETAKERCPSRVLPSHEAEARHRVAGCLALLLALKSRRSRKIGGHLDATGSPAPPAAVAPSPTDAPSMAAEAEVEARRLLDPLESLPIQDLGVKEIASTLACASFVGLVEAQDQLQLVVLRALRWAVNSTVPGACRNVRRRICQRLKRKLGNCLPGTELLRVMECFKNWQEELLAFGLWDSQGIVLVPSEPGSEALTVKAEVPGNWQLKEIPVLWTFIHFDEALPNRDVARRRCQSAG